MVQLPRAILSFLAAMFVVQSLLVFLPEVILFISEFFQK